MRTRLLRQGILALLVAGGPLSSLGSGDAMIPFSAGSLPLQTVATIQLSGGSSRFDYQSLDEQRHLLFIAHLGASLVHVVDTRSRRVVATIHDMAGVHGVLVVPQLRRVYASATDDQQVAVIDERTFQLVTIDPATLHVVARNRLPGCAHDHGLLIDTTRRLAFVACDGNARLLVVDLYSYRVRSVQSVGQDPDVLAFDAGLRRLYVAAESGIVAVFDERGRSLIKLGQAFVAQEAHTIAVDSRTHRVYLPLEGTHNHPALRILAPRGAG